MKAHLTSKISFLQDGFRPAFSSLFSYISFSYSPSPVHHTGFYFYIFFSCIFAVFILLSSGTLTLRLFSARLMTVTRKFRLSIGLLRQSISECSQKKNERVELEKFLSSCTHKYLWAISIYQIYQLYCMYMHNFLALAMYKWWLVYCIIMITVKNNIILILYRLFQMLLWL